MSTREALNLLQRYDRTLDRHEREAIQSLDASLLRAFQQLEQQLRLSYPALQNTPIIRRQAMIAQQLASVLDLANGSQGEYQRAFEQLIQQASSEGGQSAADVTSLFDDELGQQMSAFADVPIEAVAAQARGAADRMHRHGADFAGKASALIETNLTLGQSIASTARALRNELGITRGKAEQIARTESIGAFDSAAQQRYEDAGLYSQIFSVGDRRVCPYCAYRNGRVYKTTDIKLPLHPSDRCYRVPWSKDWAEMGLVDEEFVNQFAANGIEQIRGAGKEPDSGLAPFERLNRRPKPPRSVWSPGSRKYRQAVRRRREPEPTPTPTPPPIRTQQDLTFPDSVEGLEDVRGLGGSTGARLVRDPSTGQQYVLKRGASEGHLREEFAADEAYRALGINVPRGRMYESDDGPIKLTEFIDGEPLKALKGDRRRAANEQLGEHFAADALLGNWDVVGQSYDNILVGRDGRVWRIDNGGALRYRAQGEIKLDQYWNSYPDELFTLRNSAINRQTADAFSAVSYEQIVGQIEGLSSRRRSLLNSLPEELRETVGNRLTEMERVARISRTLNNDRFNWGYTEDFVRHSLNMRNEGLIDRLPTRFDLGRNNQVYDENGRSFDHLRGRNSLVQELSSYMEGEGLNYNQISEWMHSQAGSSWNRNPQALKAALANARNNWDDYYWYEGQSKAQEYYESIVDRYPRYTDTLAAFHAWNYELMSRIEMPNNDRQRGVMRLYRTENEKVLRSAGVSRGSGRTMRRGAAESASAFTPIRAVAGNELTIQDVPHHRILGTYFQSQTPMSNSAGFAGDRENEIVFIPDGIEFEYIGQNTQNRQISLSAQPTLTVKEEEILISQKEQELFSQTSEGPDLDDLIYAEAEEEEENPELDAEINEIMSNLWG